MSTQICFKNVFFKYRQRDRWLLKDVSVNFQVGDFVVLSGPNGVGKTTLVSLMLGMLEPNSGAILSPYEKAGMVSYLPQKSTYNSMPMKVIDVLTSVFVCSRTFFFSQYKEQVKKAKALLSSLDMEHLAYRRFDSLSGGQMQKILLSRVFLLPTPLIFLDEPFANMDQESKKIFADKLRILQKESAILLISHDMNFIAEHQGSLWYLGDGNLNCYGSVHDMEYAFFHQKTAEKTRCCF